MHMVWEQITTDNTDFYDSFIARTSPSQFYPIETSSLFTLPYNVSSSFSKIVVLLAGKDRTLGQKVCTTKQTSTHIGSI